MNTLLYNYTYPCHNGNQAIYQHIREHGAISIIQNENSKQEIRDHFFKTHNILTFKNQTYWHLVIPYQIETISDVISTNLYTFFRLSKEYQHKTFTQQQILIAKNHGILEETKPGQILIVHHKVNNLDWIADHTSPEKLTKYKSIYQ